jgi:c(7)-type cytochrome triheme protein
MGKKVLVLTVVMMASILLAVGMALAVPADKTIVYEVKGADKVTFEGKGHADKGLKCNDCHIKVFPMKRSPAGTYTMENMNKGENCGACHNGEKAFKSGDPANCAKCHKK